VKDVIQEAGDEDVSPAHVDDRRAVFDGIENGGGDVVFLTVSAGGEGAQVHHPAAGGGPGDAEAVAGHGGDDAAYSGAMPHLVHRIGIASAIIAAVRIVRGIGKIVALHVIDETVAVVIHAVQVEGVGQAVPVQILAGVDPEILLQVGVVIVDAGVDHADDDLAAAPSALPAGRSGNLAQAILPAEEGIVGRIVEVKAARRPGPDHLRKPLQLFGEGISAGRRGQSEDEPFS